MNEIVIDGTNGVMGRIASYSAKQALMGKKVIIVNVNKVIVIGRKEEIVAKYKDLIQKGGSSLKGPKIIRTPERILKRVARGMLSHKQDRGRDALKRIICYNEVPEKYKESEKKDIFKNNQYQKAITLKELVSKLK